MLVPARRLDPEWMDREGNAPADLEGALADIRSVNRLLGGSKVVVDAVEPYLIASDGDRPLTILDVGTGGADIPLAITTAARRLGRRAHVVAIDRDPVTVALARRAVGLSDEVRVEQADAFEPGFAPGSFDVVVASMFLHHFDEPAAIRLVAGFLSLARRAVLINDLRRHAIPWAFISAAARITRRHPMFVHDAPLSVLRGFTVAELERIATAAGAKRASVTARWPFRLLLTIRAGAGA